MKILSEDHWLIKQTLGTNTYFRPVYIPRDGYPRKMQTNWLNDLYKDGEVDVIIDVHKVKRTDAIKGLQKKVTEFMSSLSWQTRRGNIDQINDLRTKIEDTETLMDEIQFNENDMFNVATMAILYAQDEKSLNRFSEFVEDVMAAKFFKLITMYDRVKKGYLSCLPLGKNYINDAYRNLDRRSLSTFAPFISGSGKYIGGVPIGNNMITGQKEFINSFGNEKYRPQNYNMGIFGIPGSGKSLTMKLLEAREITAGNTYYCNIDPEGEFNRLTRRLGGINLEIHEEADIIINPCALNFSDIPLVDKDDEELELLEDDDEKEVVTVNGRKYLRFVPVHEKINELLDFFDIITRGKSDEGLNVFERNYIEIAIKKVFDNHGITTHPSSLFQDEVKEVDGQLIQSQVRKKEPEIIEIYECLKDEFGKEPKAQRILAAIEPFLRTGSKPIFDGQTYLGRGVTQSMENARLINFDISQMEEGFLRPIAYHVILHYLWEHFIKNMNNALKKKKILCDELWQFIDNDLTVSFFEKVARRIRKRNGGLLYASQDFVRLLEHKKSRGILSSTYSFFFMEQNKIDLKRIKENFDLTEGEINILFSNPEKGEGILRIGKSSVWLKTDPSDEELLFIESNQAVLEERKKQKAQQMI